MRTFFYALVAVSLSTGLCGAQTSQDTRLIACSCEFKDSVCLTSAQMAQHAMKIEMAVDRMGNHSNYQGVAVFQIGFDEKGKVTGAEALTGHPLGVSHLMEAVSKWRFKPVIVNGVRKTGCGKLIVEFAMKNNMPSTKVLEQE